MIRKIKTLLAFIFYKKGVLAELEVLRSGLNRRVAVENEIADHIRKKTSPTEETLRRWYMELGVPEKYWRKS